MSTPTDTVSKSSNTSAVKQAEGLLASFKTKVGTLLGRDFTKLGSAHTISIALLIIGFLVCVRVLPLGLGFGIQLSLAGFFLFALRSLRAFEERMNAKMFPATQVH